MDDAPSSKGEFRRAVDFLSRVNTWVVDGKKVKDSCPISTGRQELLERRELLSWGKESVHSLLSTFGWDSGSFLAYHTKYLTSVLENLISSVGL